MRPKEGEHLRFPEVHDCLDSHTTPTSSKHLHVLQPVVSDTHGHQSQGRLCQEPGGDTGREVAPMAPPSGGTLV